MAKREVKPRTEWMEMFYTGVGVPWRYEPGALKLEALEREGWKVFTVTVTSIVLRRPLKDRAFRVSETDTLIR